MKRTIVWMTALAAIAAARPTRGELQTEEQKVNGGTLTVFRMTVTPAAEPVPALKHRLVMREIDEKAGNAAPMYYRAILAGQTATKELKATFGDLYDEVIDVSTAARPLVSHLRSAVGVIDSSNVMIHLREAAARRDCDWAFDIQSERGLDVIAFLLPELQECRQLSRYLALRARLAIAEARFDDALDDLRINLKMARDVASEPLLVNGLVGIAQAGMGNRAIIDLIAAPRSPNMYWALTELPDPFVDLRQAIRFEMSSVLRIFPFLRDAEKQEHSPDEWARLLAQGLVDLAPVSGGGHGVIGELGSRLGATGLGLASYGPAKERLVDSGFDAKRVEPMPVGQVIAIDAAREFRRIADETEKWWYLPYGAVEEREDRARDELIGKNFEGGYGRLLARVLLPAISAARTAQERLGWQTDALRIVEAIRIYAADAGKLPERLEDIKAVPIPQNRATRKPYQYQLNGDTAVLELPFSDGFPGVAWRFEIQLAN